MGDNDYFLINLKCRESAYRQRTFGEKLEQKVRAFFWRHEILRELLILSGPLLVLLLCVGLAALVAWLANPAHKWPFQ